MILYLIRHGESTFNAEGRIQGQCDIPLSPHGRRQADALAKAIADLPIDAIHASPLTRARETAQPIADAMGLEIAFDDRLMEIHAGIFQGLRWSEIESSHPSHARSWLAQEPDFVIPGGESRRALMERGREVLEAIRALNHDQAAIVGHGGVLSGAIKGLLGIPAERNPFSLYNASISKVVWKDQFRLMTLNQVEHLRDVNRGEMGQGGDL